MFFLSLLNNIGAGFKFNQTKSQKRRNAKLRTGELVKDLMLS
jgi:hypothetical protein